MYTSIDRSIGTVFFNWSFIHDEVRNRLSEETSKKLTNIHFALRSNECLDEDDIEEEEKN